jgi:hypothetical protein
MSKRSEKTVFSGKAQPAIDEAVTLVRMLAQSLRLRPDAIAEGVPVKDTLAGVR